MRRSRGRPRDSKGIFIQSDKFTSYFFGPINTPSINLVNRDEGNVEKRESSVAVVASNKETPYTEETI